MLADAGQGVLVAEWRSTGQTGQTGQITPGQCGLELAFQHGGTISASLCASSSKA